MPTLEWIGKDKVVNHHLDVPYRVLERQYSFDQNGQHIEDNGSDNMIIHSLIFMEWAMNCKVCVLWALW